MAMKIGEEVIRQRKWGGDCRSVKIRLSNNGAMEIAIKVKRLWKWAGDYRAVKIGKEIIPHSKSYCAPNHNDKSGP